MPPAGAGLPALPADRAVVVVQAPPGATLSVNNREFPLTAPQSSFITPRLRAGQGLPLQRQGERQTGTVNRCPGAALTVLAGQVVRVLFDKCARAATASNAGGRHPARPVLIRFTTAEQGGVSPLMLLIGCSRPPLAGVIFADPHAAPCRINGMLLADLARPASPEEYHRVIGQQVLRHEPLRPEVRAYYLAKGRVLAWFLRPRHDQRGGPAGSWASGLRVGDEAGTGGTDRYSLLGLTGPYRAAEGVGAGEREGRAGCRGGSGHPALIAYVKSSGSWSIIARVFRLTAMTWPTKRTMYSSSSGRFRSEIGLPLASLSTWYCSITHSEALRLPSWY